MLFFSLFSLLGLSPWDLRKAIFRCNLLNGCTLLPDGSKRFAMKTEQRDKGTKSQKDKGTRGQKDKGTMRQRDNRTKGQRDRGTTELEKTISVFNPDFLGKPICRKKRINYNNLKSLQNCINQ